MKFFYPTLAILVLCFFWFYAFNFIFHFLMTSPNFIHNDPPFWAVLLLGAYLLVLDFESSKTFRK